MTEAPSPPPALRVDDGPIAVSSSELVVTVDHTDLSPEPRWVQAARPSSTVSWVLQGQDQGPKLVVQLPPSALALPVGPEDATELQAALVVAGTRRPIALTLERVHLALDPAGLSLELRGHTPAGQRVALVARQRPTAIRVTTLAAVGEAEAHALLAPLIDRLSGGLRGGAIRPFYLGDEGDQTLTLTYEPADFLAAQAAAEAEATRAQEEAEAAAAEARRAERMKPAPTPAPSRPLVAGRRGTAVMQANLHFRSERERPGWWRFDLALIVDEASGEDGALAPTLSGLFRPPQGLPEPGLVAELSGGEAELEGWLGNDAPELETLHLRFSLGDRGLAEVEWRAHYDDAEGAGPALLHFQGPVQWAIHPWDPGPR